LPNHTIYTPKSPPANEKLPVIVWGNGFCSGQGKMFYNFLNELSSYGFFIISNGKASFGGSGRENYTDLITSIDWVKSNPAVKKYGNVDTNMIIASGQSCGGMEAVC
jgi:dipeptidyl aminopeptidase/acylaminoacyl peptidase